MSERKLMFDPVHRTLRNAHGKILKNMVCPRLKSWTNLSDGGENSISQRYCDSCEKAVLDTAYMSIEEVVGAVKRDPDVCFRIRLDQRNIEVKVQNDE